MGAWVEIFIRDFTDDPIDEAAFAINIEVQWPSPEVSTAENNQEQDYTVLLQAGLEQFRDSSK